MKPLVLTALNTIKPTDKILVGDECFPVIGDALTPLEVQKIMSSLRGLKYHWNCLEKAKIVVSTLGRGHVILGSLIVISGDHASTYGYGFNPPFEFHAWVQVGDLVTDVALPGVIDMGITTSDQYGPYIVDREPFILAGKPLPWTIYEVKEIY